MEAQQTEEPNDEDVEAQQTEEPNDEDHKELAE